MIMAVKSYQRIIGCIFFLGIQLGFGVQAFGQAPAVTSPAFEASLGYVYMRSDVEPSEKADLRGIDGNGLVRFAPKWAGQIDFTYARASDVLGLPHKDSVFSGLVGPVYYPLNGRRLKVFVHALGGLAWEDSAVAINPTSYYSGYETRFSYAAGGGLEETLVGPFAVRATGDYQHTTFVNSNLALQGQSNLRVTLGLVYRFGRR
jgi:opacity protein-like surface antigen